MRIIKKYFALLFFGLFLLAACQSSGDKNNTASSHSAKKPESRLTPDGMAVFRKYCVTCHGADGTLGLNGAKDFRQSTLTLEERIQVITHGKKLMTPFEGLLTPEEIKVVAEYTQTLSNRK